MGNISDLFNSIPGTRRDWKEDWKETSRLDWKFDWTSGDDMTPVLTNTFVVAKNGNDGTGDGSFSKPFLSIQKAHDAAETSLDPSAGVTILIMPGSYTESLAITRPRTSFVGLSGIEFGTVIQTAVTVIPSRSVAHPGNSAFLFDNVFFNVGGNQDALTYSGSAFSGALNLNRVRIYTTNGKGVVMNNTATDYDSAAGASNNRLRWVDVDIQTANGNKNAVELQNVYGTVKAAYLYGGTAEATVMGVGANVTFSDTTFETNGARVASVASSGMLLTRSSTFRNNQVNGNGVDLASGAYLVAGDTTFAHATTVANSGFAIKGVAGSVVMYSNLSFVNTNPANPVINNRVSTAATRLPATTTITTA